jgi:CheY-like chemotaxis protein
MFDDGLSFCVNFLGMSSQLPLRGRPLILHVEDDKAQAEMLKSILEESGFLVLQASTAEEALRIFKQESSVSLVLADHMLSGKTGTQLAAEIKKVKRTVPVVMHSGHPPVTMNNIDGFMDKGEPPAILVDFIWELVRRFWM